MQLSLKGEVIHFPNNPEDHSPGLSELYGTYMNKPVLLTPPPAGRESSKRDFVTSSRSLIGFKVLYLDILIPILPLLMLDDDIHLRSLELAHCLEEFFFVRDRFNPFDCL